MRRLAILSFAATLLLSQPAAEVEITAEPHHHFAFENQSVRVFKVEVAPRSETLMHWHRHDYIFVTLGASHVSNDVKGKAPVELTLPDGDTRFLAGPILHLARNLSDQPFRNVTIELLEDDKLRQSAASVHWDEERGLDILQGGTREVLFVKDGVRVSEVELQPGGVVPMHHHKGGHLFVAVSDLDLKEAGTAGRPQMQGHFQSGDSRWLAGNYSHSITNVGRRPARFVTLEFP